MSSSNHQTNQNPPVNSNDEMSIMDLAIIIGRYRYFALIIFFVISVPAMFQIATFEKSYAINSVLEIGTWADNELIESQASLRLKLQTGLIPTEITALSSAGVRDTDRFFINVLTPKKSNIVHLTSKSRSDTEKTYIALHKQLVDTVKLQHDRKINEQKKQLDQLISTLNDQIKNADIPDSLMESRMTLETKRAALRNTNIQVSGQKSLLPQGPSRKLLALIAIIASLIIALFIPLILEFLIRVRHQLEN